MLTQKQNNIDRISQKILNGKGSDESKVSRIQKLYSENFVPSNAFRFGEY